MSNLLELLNEYRRKKRDLKFNIFNASEAEDILKIPTGIFVLDYTLQGGIPVGKITEVNGAYSSGKTTLALIIAEQFLQVFQEKEVLFVDFEQSFDKTWALNFISDPTRLKVVVPPYGEAGLDFLLHCVASEADISLYIIDSLASVVSLVEDEESMFEQQVGLQGKLLAKFFRKLLTTNAKLKTAPSFVMLNQVRTKIGQRSFAPVIAPAGGSAHEFYSALILRMYTKGFIENEEGIPVRQVFNFTIYKNKTGGTPNISGEFQLCLKPIDTFRVGECYDVSTIIKIAKATQLLEKVKGKYTVLDSEFPTLDSITHALHQNRELRIAYKDYLLRKLCSEM